MPRVAIGMRDRMPIDPTGEGRGLPTGLATACVRAGDQGTRQIRQLALIFEDGSQCEGADTSLAAIREGDVIEIRGHHDVKGVPVVDPEWRECDEAQLVSIAQAGPKGAPGPQAAGGGPR